MTFLSGSGASALRAPEGFELGFKRHPKGAVFRLLDARPGIQRFAQLNWAAP
jgi:hypothetical protein